MLHALAYPSSHVDEVTLRILVDDEPGSRALLTEHGFSCWVQTDTGRVLFDAGLAGALVTNAHRLGVDLSTADALVLSHGHYDHVGGIALLSRQQRIARVVAHPSFDAPHRSRSTGLDRDVGVPEAVRDALAISPVQKRREPTEIVPGVWATGEIPRVTDEDCGGPFFEDHAGEHSDPLLDDQALVVRHRTGLVVLLGCAHAGVVNTLLYARQLFPSEPVVGVVGGMHLQNASKPRLEATVLELVSSDATLVAPAHCTGTEAKRALREALGPRYHGAATGSMLQLDRQASWRLL